MADNKTRHTFARIDLDTEPSAVQGNSSAIAASNIWFERGSITAARGNELIEYTLPEGRCKSLGWCDDNAGGILYFLWSETGKHQVVRFDVAATACTLVLEHEALNLKEDKPVLGAVVLDGLLVYLDADGAFRSIPMNTAERAAAVAALPADPLALHLVHQPPHAAPTAERKELSNPLDARFKYNQVAGHAYQFCLQYNYAGGELTPLGPYSDVSTRIVSTAGELADPRNYLEVSLPTGQFAPPPQVKHLRVLVRRDAEPVFEVATVLERDATGAFPTTFDFYGATTGEAIASLDAGKLHEAVPIAAGCMTVARSRVFAGDCTEGYDATTVAVSYAIKTDTGDDATDTGTVYERNTEYVYSYQAPTGEELTESGNRATYFTPVTGTYPDEGSTYQQVEQRTGIWYQKPGTTPRSYQDVFVALASDEVNHQVTTLTGQSLAPTGATPPSGLDGVQTLHERTSYRVGLAFYDALGRTAGGTNTKDVLVPAQDYDTVRVQNLSWKLTQGSGIPAWATSYQFLLSKNRTTSYYRQFRGAATRQYHGDLNGTPTLKNPSEPQANLQAVWISLQYLLSGGRGYTFEPGDRVRFPQLGPTADYPILYQRDTYIAITGAALTRLLTADNPNTPVVEIYRPVDVTAGDAVLYERGPRYAILNPHTPERAYSALSGTLEGDSYLVEGLEAVSPVFSQEEWLDAERGRAIPVLPNPTQLRRASLVRYSGVKVQGTKLMGLSIWDATGQDDLPQEQGAIVRLTVADQTQADGSLLLAVQERGAESRYLGQTAIQQADGQTTLALTKGVIGGGNALKGGYGCQPEHAASLVSNKGRVFWYCHESRELIRYAQNGLIGLADQYTFANRLQKVGDEHGSKAVTAGYDSRKARKEVWLTFPDGPTLAWSEKRETWVDTYTAQPECMAHTGQTVITFQNGNLWHHSKQAPYANFFDNPQPATVRFTCAAGPGVSKLWKTIGLESEGLWLPTALSIRRGGSVAMESEMRAPWLTYLEGIYRGAFRRDKNSPGGLLSGRPLVGERLSVELTAPTVEATADFPALSAATVGWVIRGGQA